MSDDEDEDEQIVNKQPNKAEETKELDDEGEQIVEEKTFEPELDIPAVAEEEEKTAAG